MPVLFDDTYQTITSSSEGLFKEKGSKFLAFAFPIDADSEAKQHLGQLRDLHPKAVHHCYAYRLGADKMSFRMSDDGEPSGTAGRPILNTLYSKNLTNILVVVVRYFGGTLLGVPGLINAYKTATEASLTEAEIITRHFSSIYELAFSYIQMNEVMKIVKELDLSVIEQHFDMDCQMKVEVRTSWLERFSTRCEKIEGLTVQLT